MSGSDHFQEINNHKHLKQKKWHLTTQRDTCMTL